jgi:Domain of Unknown Function (DUF1259)
MKNPSALVIIALLLSATIPASAQQSIDTAAIVKALGRNGTAMPGGVYRVSFPRSDLRVTIGSIRIAPGLALGSYAAFEPAGAGALAAGDLVLLEDEIEPVTQSLQASGFQITALHNHLRNERPHVMYLHFMATGDAATIATNLHKALSLTHTPLVTPKPPDMSAPWFASDLQQSLGRTGKSTNGVISISIARQEDVTMDGTPIAPAMGVATALNFQGVGNARVATTGDFVLIGSEVVPVERTLISHGFEVTALHSHMIDDSPHLYYMHFWAVDTPPAIGSALKDALSHVAVKAP